MQDFYITYVHAMLAKLGIRIWAPDLEEAPGSLYNEACRIVALMTFRQIACSGAYQYMRANLTYCSDLGLLSSAYDHYVHYVLAEKYRKENREKGWNERDVVRKAVQRARQRLRDHRYKFLVMHKYPKRYQVIASDVNAHSDDEYNAQLGVYVIKTLAYRSERATTFFQRLDRKIKEVDAMLVDFYRPEWFNERNHSEKMIAADVGDVAFVSVKDIPSGSKEHPDERLSDRAFNNKYWHLTIKDYEIEPDTPEDSDNYSDEMIDLDANNQLDVDQNFVEQEIIKHEQREVELADEVDDVNEKDGRCLGYEITKGECKGFQF
ncbi:hypothetical protein O181_061825 [Austropuccinia psidii MF-1]|uniref:Uncharacterized protein n=1 Tax=Austropuccinia psidii MF-1 TaxID=1389203 RepID=A0A9Q3EN70_9BASI|nr:hypothetical protein [Austropuccinia psidii MF-1]